MKKKLFILIALCLASCSNSPSQPESKQTAKVTPAAASQEQGGVYATYPPGQVMDLIRQKKDLLIIDVRSPEELREGKIENSTLIPFWDIMKGNYNIPQGRPVLLICAVGGRSYAAMQILAQKGYKEIYNLQGGISAWKQANLPLVQ